MKYDCVVTVESTDKPQKPRVVYRKNGDIEIFFSVTGRTLDKLLNKIAGFEHEFNDD